MKNLTKIILSTALLTSASFVIAEPASANDQTMDKYSQLCLSVLKSEREFISKARELKITKNERDRLVCNDLSVEEFASNYRLTEENNIATVQ